MSKKLLLDIAERALATAIEAYLAVFIPVLVTGVTGDELKAASLSALVAACAAALSVLKGVAASFVGNSDSAGFVD